MNKMIFTQITIEIKEEPNQRNLIDSFLIFIIMIEEKIML